MNGIKLTEAITRSRQDFLFSSAGGVSADNIRPLKSSAAVNVSIIIFFYGKLAIHPNSKKYVTYTYDPYELSVWKNFQLISWNLMLFILISVLCFFT